MTSNERRRTAERLRELAISDATRYAEPFCEQLTDIVDFPFDGTNKLANVADNLADLIDPTCEAIEHGRPDESHVCKSCSKCSYGWFEDINDKPYSFCPNCGARVVRPND